MKREADGWRELAIAALVIAVVVMLIVPVPRPLLDVLLALNIAIAVALLMAAVFTPRPLAFAVVPDAARRHDAVPRRASRSRRRGSILADADAGAVVRAFGSSVVAGEPGRRPRRVRGDHDRPADRRRARRRARRRGRGAVRARRDARQADGDRRRAARRRDRSPTPRATRRADARARVAALRRDGRRDAVRQGRRDRRDRDRRHQPDRRPRRSASAAAACPPARRCTRTRCSRSAPASSRRSRRCSSRSRRACSSRASRAPAIARSARISARSSVAARARRRRDPARRARARARPAARRRSSCSACSPPVGALLVARAARPRRVELDEPGADAARGPRLALRLSPALHDALAAKLAALHAVLAAARDQASRVPPLAIARDATLGANEVALAIDGTPVAWLSLAGDPLDALARSCPPRSRRSCPSCSASIASPRSSSAPPRTRPCSSREVVPRVVALPVLAEVAAPARARAACRSTISPACSRRSRSRRAGGGFTAATCPRSSSTLRGQLRRQITRALGAARPARGLHRRRDDRGCACAARSIAATARRCSRSSPRSRRTSSPRSAASSAAARPCCWSAATSAATCAALLEPELPDDRDPRRARARARHRGDDRRPHRCRRKALALLLARDAPRTRDRSTAARASAARCSRPATAAIAAGSSSRSMSSRSSQYGGLARVRALRREPSRPRRAPASSTRPAPRGRRLVVDSPRRPRRGSRSTRAAGRRRHAHDDRRSTARSASRSTPAATS